MCSCLSATGADQVNLARWLLLPCIAVVLLLAGYSAVVAVDTALQIADRDACHLGMQFEVESATTIDTRWFPPSAICRYVTLGTPEIVTESRWRLYSPLLIFPLLGALVRAFVRQGPRRD